jgi:hypothetical protein
MTLGKITFAGITIAVTGWMVLVAIPFMFSALFYFINQILSGLLFIIGIIVLAIFVYAFINGGHR